MDKKKKTTNYHISFETLVLKPILKENKMSTQVIEQKQELLVYEKPKSIVVRSLKYYGNTLKNAVILSKEKLGDRHKTPIIVAHDFGVPFIFLPTMSPRSPHNVWISLHGIDDIVPDEMGCIVHLINGTTIKLNASTTTMHRQFTFGVLLEKEFQKKQRRLNRPFFYQQPDIQRENDNKEEDDDKKES